MANLLSALHSKKIIKSIPLELEGTWAAQNPVLAVKFLRFFVSGATSSLYVSTDPVDFAVSADGQTLIWGGTVYDRIDGFSTQTIVSHWKENASGDDVIFRVDHSYTWHFANSAQETFGLWDVVPGGGPTGGKLKSEEFRATVSATASEITFDVPYANDEVVPYAISGSTLSLVVGGQTYVYDKV